MGCKKYRDKMKALTDKNKRLKSEVADLESKVKTTKQRMVELGILSDVSKVKQENLQNSEKGIPNFVCNTQISSICVQSETVHSIENSKISLEPQNSRDIGITSLDCDSYRNSGDSDD